MKDPARRWLILVGMLFVLAGLGGWTKPPISTAASSAQSLAVSEPKAIPPDSSDSSYAKDQPETGQPSKQKLEPTTIKDAKIVQGEDQMTKRISIQIQDQNFPAVLASTQAADELYGMLEQGPITIHAHSYGGFEQVGDLGRKLTAADRQTTTEPGDLVLYQSNQIVLFYGSNSWAYTRLGYIEKPKGLAEILGSGDVTYTLSLLTD